MYTDEQFEQLEQDERTLTEEAIIAMLFILAAIHLDLESAIREFYQKYGKDGVVTYQEARKWVSQQDRQRRINALLLVLTYEFGDALDKLETQFRRFLTDVVGKESTFFGVKIDVDKVLSRTWGIDDLYWLDRLKNDVDLWKTYVATDLKRAILQGKNIDDVLKQLDKRFDSIYYVLETLGLSESTAVGSISRQEIFKELGCSKYQFYTKPDERRCETCGSMHGLIFPVSAYEVGVTASPIHPRCRCWEVPILE